MSFEFAAVVGQHILDLAGKESHDKVKEVSESLRGMRLGGNGEGGSGIYVYGGENVYSFAVSLLLYGI